MNNKLENLSLKPVARLVAGSFAAAVTTAAFAQDIAIVEYEQTGEPLSGPYAVVIEHDPGLDTHTIFRPAELSMDEYPVLVWGEGGCAKNGMMFAEFLSEVASHGYVIIADGPPGGIGSGAGGPGAPGGGGARAGGPPEGGARAGGPPPGGGGGARAGGPGGGGGRAGGAPGGGPGGMGNMVNGTDLVAAIDWIEAESQDSSSRFYGKVNVSDVAAMGMSCGGLMSYGASNDPRVATIGIWNSGLFEADQELYDGINGSVIIVTGGESDIAYANGKRDFEDLPADIPVFYGAYPSVGHGGTYNQDNGGAYGPAAVAWLNYQLKGDTSQNGRGYFVGDDCVICQDSNWVTDSRSLR